MSCPLCTPYGLVLIFIGFAIIFLSTFYSFLMYIGIAVIISAYILPIIINRFYRDNMACQLPDAKTKS
ncbi:MAG: hypothetical protein KAJ51_15550 [Thermoplasmata archaeon]|nr:hypothetical protein [Thermoplasmata archaeon]